MNRPHSVSQGSYTPSPTDIRWQSARRFPASIRLVEPLVFAADLILIVGTSFVSGIAYHLIALGRYGNIETYLGVGILVCGNFSTILLARGAYNSRNLFDVHRQIRDIVFAWTSAFVILLAVAFTLKIASEYSRGATIVFFATGAAALIFSRVAVARYLRTTMAAGSFGRRKILLIGEQSRLASKTIGELQQCGYMPVAEFELPDNLSGKIDDIVAGVITATQREPIEAIFLLVAWQRGADIDRILRALRVSSVPIHLVPDENALELLSHPIIHVGRVWTSELKRAPLTASEQILKRTLDLILAGIGLILLSPLMLAVAALIKLDSPGPVVFAQQRNGFNGRSFRIFKFRTMTVLEDGPVIQQATQDDPRVTRIGRLLRRTSIDELPQLVNVLHGDMSLVGPRPHATAHNDEYEKLIDTYAMRYHVKPGMSGWAQVNGYRGETRSVELMAQRVEYDLWYINNWSLRLDLRIMLKSLMIVFS
jgi:undecaprenyl-phosphate galactose phosphotransferase/putative colanic acid biosynthesis UDP-glucose lipid carrier transferase